MQINAEIQEEKIKKEVLSKLKSVRKILWKEKKSDPELEDAFIKKFGLNKIISKLLVSRGIDTTTYNKFFNLLNSTFSPNPNLWSNVMNSSYFWVFFFYFFSYP